MFYLLQSFFFTNICVIDNNNLTVDRPCSLNWNSTEIPPLIFRLVLLAAVLQLLGPIILTNSLINLMNIKTLQTHDTKITSTKLSLAYHLQYLQLLRIVPLRFNLQTLRPPVPASFLLSQFLLRLLRSTWHRTYWIRWFWLDKGTDCKHRGEAIWSILVHRLHTHHRFQTISLCAICKVSPLFNLCFLKFLAVPVRLWFPVLLKSACLVWESSQSLILRLFPCSSTNYAHGIQD